MSAGDPPTMEDAVGRRFCRRRLNHDVMEFGSDDVHLGGEENVEAGSSGSSSDPFRPSVTSLPDAQVPNKPNVNQSITDMARTIAQAIEHMVVEIEKEKQISKCDLMCSEETRKDENTVIERQDNVSREIQERTSQCLYKKTEAIQL